MRVVLALVLLASVALPAASAVAQQGAARPDSGQTCVLVIENVDRQGSYTQTPAGTNYFAGGNVRIRCRDVNVRMASDSVAAYGGRTVEFIGRVRYRDSTVSMDADRGTYFKDGERWEARGRVVARNLETGSTLRGPTLDYLRPMAGVRDTLEMYAIGRPRVDYVTRDSTGKPGEPYVIVADRLRMQGDDRVWAGGSVTIDRSDFAARGDSMRLQTGATGDGTLLGRPILRGLGTDSFTLTGRRIDFRLDDRELTYVVAKGNARAVGSQRDLVADTIALDVNARKLEQTLAWGDSIRPYVTSPDYEMRADSLAIDSPDQRLREMRAFGGAWLATATDSVTRERDWLTGDSVVAEFVLRDSTDRGTAAVKSMKARGKARAYHQVKDPKRPGRPSLNYVRGDTVTITMKPPVEGEEQVVERVDVVGRVDGIQLEPKKDTPAGGGARDSAARVPAAARDSTAARDTTTRDPIVPDSAGVASP